MPTPIVIDLSHHNSIPQGLEDAKKAGIIGVIHKASEGTSYVDSDVDARWYLAKRAGMLWGLYHFLQPGDMSKQAQHFVDVAMKNGDNHTLLVADHEVADVSLDDLYEFLCEVERLTGRIPAIYSGHVLKDQLAGKSQDRFRGYRLWLAQYGSQPSLPPGWNDYWLWQYTDQGSVPGVTAPTDLNAGDANEVIHNWSGIVEPMPEPVPPEAPVVFVNIQAPSNVEVIVYINGVEYGK